jgi:hypothetical protein
MIYKELIENSPKKGVCMMFKVKHLRMKMSGVSNIKDIAKKGFLEF